jgi:hypothetical protein
MRVGTAVEIRSVLLLMSRFDDSQLACALQLSKTSGRAEIDLLFCVGATAFGDYLPDLCLALLDSLVV